ncbi:MAG: dethiobiotin synthase [Planctomycetia bacterium]|nr:dethiobiotin synthase [Planctomycetia bacterium]
MPGLFITGTDTGVGKTYVAARIAQTLLAAGHRVGVYKPAASGCHSVEGEAVCDDALVLWNAAGRPGELGQVCPQRFAAPLAPHLAARAEGLELSEELLRTGLDYWRTTSDVVVVEGAGGLLSPLSDDEYVADLAADFGYPLVVISDNSIGTIHRTLATLVVAATFRDGLSVAGVILNQPRPDRADASVDSNLSELRARSVPPVLGQVTWQGELPPGIDWFALAAG